MFRNKLNLRNVVAIAICLAGMTIFSGCEKNSDNDNNPNEIGDVYVGTYTWSNLTRDWSWSSTPTIELKNGKYTYTGLSNDSYYDSGSGNFTIKDNTIIFELTYYPIPMEAIGVVDGWLLKGEYEYKLEGDKLSFSKTSTVMADEYRYEFELKKNASR